MTVDTRKDLDAVVGGYVCVDLFPDLSVAARSGSFANRLRPGALIECGPLAISLGGAVANTGLALKRFGRAVELCGLVGADRMGDVAAGLFAAQGEFQGIRRTDAAETAYGIVLAPPGVDRMFLESTGTNRVFTSDDVDYDCVARGRLFHFGYPPLMPRLFADGGAELERMFARAHERGAATSMDLSLPDPESDAGHVDWSDILRRALPHVDVVVPSIEEILFMLDRDRYAAAAAAGGNMIAAIPDSVYPELAARLLDMGASIAMIKAGSRGLYVAAGALDGWERGPLPLKPAEWRNRSAWVDAAPDEPARIMNACGAGDAAVAGFLAALLTGESLERAGCLATVAGRDSLYGPDALTGLRDWSAMLAELDAAGR